MNKVLVVTAACFLFAAVAFGQTRKVTVIETKTVPSGAEITEKLLEECIVTLPLVKELEADVKAGSEYLKEINGEAGKNDHVRVYTASVTVNYQVRQKVLIIVTASDGQEPVMREEVRTVMKKTEPIWSDMEGGDIFAGRSNRRYYYSTAEMAAASAKKRAEVWIKQQQHVVCAK